MSYAPADAFRMRVAVEIPPRGPFSVRRLGDGATFVLPEVWLEDVTFGPLGHIEGTLIASRDARVRTKNGWGRIRMDRVASGCFHDSNGSCVDKAAFAWIGADDIEGMGARRQADEASAVGLPWLGPQRRTWQGDLGGLNFDRPSPEQVQESVSAVLAERPGSVIVDGSDDWDAPDYVRPVVLVQQLGVAPLAWWHTGTSGQSPSGALFDRRSYRRFRRAYRHRFGCYPEQVGDVDAGRRGCRCWQGNGFRIYR